jgi:hypothetical protein
MLITCPSAPESWVAVIRTDIINLHADDSTVAVGYVRFALRYTAWAIQTLAHVEGTLGSYIVYARRP